MRRAAWVSVVRILLTIGACQVVSPAYIGSAQAPTDLAAQATENAQRPDEARDRADLGRPVIPMMAYYYIWFDDASWKRAKKDYPLLGMYSSDDRTVMRVHVQQAKEAGIDGFIVSWKSTPKLDRRLDALAAIALENDFDLWIIYQGLDFDRNPLPIERIDADLDRLANLYGEHPAFGMFGQPVVIWSGTWKFTRPEIFTIATAHRDRLTLLASERNVDGFNRIADIVEGNAYYWASVNPDTFVGYPDKLARMGEAVHTAGGLWVAPAAPGFDARMVGGTSVVERRDGATLIIQLNAATRSSPDAIGIISWNEFSENTHVEPSRVYGTKALETIAGRQLLPPVRVADFDSDAPATTARIGWTGVVVLVIVLVSIAISLTAIVRRAS